MKPRATGCAVASVLAAATLGAATPAAAQLGIIRLDNWFFYQENFDDSARAQWRPRLFVPYDLAHGWTFTQRVDLPFYYTDAAGPANPGGNWKFHGSDGLVEEIVDLPARDDLRLRASLRLVFPSGGGAPFGADQWQVAPGFGFTQRYAALGKGVTVSPYVRYFYGFDPQSEDTTTKRTWNIHPTATFALTGAWSLALWPEQGITYNQRSHKWFVPVEAMLSHGVDKEWEYSVGAAVAVDDSDKSYRWLVQGRLTYFFR